MAATRDPVASGRPQPDEPGFAARRFVTFRRGWRPEVSVEALLLAASIGFALLANVPFWRGALAQRTFAAWSDLRFAAAMFVLLVAAQFLLLGVVATRRVVRPLLTFLIFTSALMSFFMLRYGIVVDPTMLRNAMRTDVREVADLWGPGLLLALLVGAKLAGLPWLVRLRRVPARRALARRTVALAMALVSGVLALLVAYQDLGSLMRNRRELRYTLTPMSALWSMGRVLAVDVNSATVARDPSEPAVRLPHTMGERRPTLFVLVVGETARAANFGLNGYARDTTPELASLDVVNFSRVTACGTSTEVSVPCMFSPFGRADYDEVRIRRHESLLHLLDRAGLRVVWIDNQSGCKGVCSALEVIDVSRDKDPDLCSEERCLDEILLRRLQQVAAGASGDLVVVLHQMGNHGPAYYRRYPGDLERFTPACTSNELGDCTRQQIVNAYDNAILYTDRFLARTIGWLEQQGQRVDATLLYVSDHGESLGERGLYLHGLPYAVAPREQVEVPMLMWFGADAARNLDVSLPCLRHRATAAASHDNLFHSVLGLLDVQTPRYRSERDLFAGCRTESVARAPEGVPGLNEGQRRVVR